MVRAFAFHQCGPGSNPGVGAICGYYLFSLILSLAPRGFSPGTPVFLSLKKPTLPDSNSIWNARTRFSKFLRTRKCSLGNLVPRRCDPSGRHQGSLRRIRKISYCKWLCKWKKLWAWDRSFVYTPILYDLKPLRKKFISISHETTLHCYFVQKFALFLKVILMPFFKRITRHACYWTFQICIQLCSFWVQKNVCRHN